MNAIRTLRLASTPLLAAAALLLPSCVQWSIGDNIRESAQWRFAVDTTHLYRCEGDKSKTTIVPEVRFHESYRTIDLIIDRRHCEPYGHEYTGRYRVLKEVRDEHGSRWLHAGELYDLAGRPLRRLPDRRRYPYWCSHYRPDTTIASAGEKTQVAAVDGQEALVPSECILGGDKRRDFKKGGLDWDKDGPYEPTIERKSCYWLAATAAAPFVYALDPALSVITTPLCLLGWGVAELFHEIVDATQSPSE